ncbi:MAG: hypothetical protein IJ875_05895 [Solobacterium sp.]|nr:hypothetical protein [Solobacterium sp.]
MTTIKTHQDASKEYAKLSSKIRYLASPDLLHYQSAKTYRSALLRNFNRIKELSQEKRKILEKELNPILTSNHSLSKKEKDTLTHYSNTLFNASRMEDVDIPLFYRITNRLLIDADKKGNTKDIIHALDRYIEACFAIMHMSSRFDFCDPTCYNYRDYGLNAAYRLLSYLPQKKFASLPDDETKEIVLVNSRYICALFLCSDSYGNEKINTLDFEQLKNSLALTNKSFYKKHAPNYNWEYHEFRCYEYINGLTEENNIRQFNDEQLEEIYHYTLAMEEMWNKNEEFFSAICPKEILNLYLSRISFLTHRLTVEQYRHQLDTIIGSDTKGQLSYHEDILNILVLSEYLYVIHLQL